MKTELLEYVIETLESLRDSNEASASNEKKEFPHGYMAGYFTGKADAYNMALETIAAFNKEECKELHNETN